MPRSTPKAVPAKKTSQKAAKAAPATKAPVRQKAKQAATLRAKPQPNGQPTDKQRLDALGETAILNMVVQGMSSRAICKTLDIGMARLFEWLAETPERSQAHARARESAAEAYDDKALETLENADRENISVAREIAAHYRWRAKAANPKRYSDKLQLDATVETKIVGDAELLAGLAKLGLTAKVHGAD